ncbi:hypothetical protein HK104_006233 [Borealophlyctis nickersoniae]|nr:hypothetical protein HK104_006233 [Borealophlyctis nickersoniae]
MNDAAAILSAYNRPLSSPQTLTETEARAAAAACAAWLKQNAVADHGSSCTARPTGYYIQSQQHAAPVSRPVRPRLPSEVLDAIIREVADDKGWASLFACSLVNKEWRRKAWTRRWKWLVVGLRDPSLATTACRFLLPWALEAMKGTQVRVLEVICDEQQQLDDLPLLLAPPTFRGIRRLDFTADDCSTLHLLMAFRTLPNLIFFECNELHDEPVAWGKHLRLGEKEENEIWRMGLGNLKVLRIHCMKFRRGGIMLQKLTTGLGPKLESLHLGLRNGETEHYEEQDFAELFRNFSKNCPYLVDFSVYDWNMRDTNSLHCFVKTQQQLVYLTVAITLTNNLSDDLIRNIAASCLSLKYLRFTAGDNITTRCFQHLATGPFLRALNVDRKHRTLVTDHNAIAEKDIIEFLRQRGKDLIYLQFPNDNDCSFAKLNEFLPNIRYLFTTSPSRSSFRDQDVLAFLEGAKKLENLWIGDSSLISKEIRDVASARKVRLNCISFPSYVNSKDWSGL